MGFLLVFNIFQLCYIVYGQNFRIDYLWASQFKTFYRVHDLSATWSEARQICEAEGTDLLIPQSLLEMDNLKLLISNMKSFYSAIFVGIHKQFSAGDFVTIKGEPIAKTWIDLIWAEGKPDNESGVAHCVVMTREGLLEDRPCKEVHPFVCSIHINRTKYNEKCGLYDMGYTLNENGKCYKFHDEPLNWHDAYMTCHSEQGTLVIINSVKEASLVTGFLGQHPGSGDAPNSNILHIGFSDLMFPFQYRTIKGQTLKEAGYDSWSPLENNEVVAKNQNRCGSISRTGFLMLTDCDLPAMFLCEKISNQTNTFSY